MQNTTKPVEPRWQSDTDWRAGTFLLIFHATWQNTSRVSELITWSHLVFPWWVLAAVEESGTDKWVHRQRTWTVEWEEEKNTVATMLWMWLMEKPLQHLRDCLEKTSSGWDYGYKQVWAGIRLRETQTVLWAYCSQKLLKSRGCSDFIPFIFAYDLVTLGGPW